MVNTEWAWAIQLGITVTHSAKQWSQLVVANWYRSPTAKILTPPSVLSSDTPLICCSLLWISSNILQPTMLTLSIITNIKRDSLVRSVFSLSWLRSWKLLYLLRSSKNAECNVMPLILNAATPVWELVTQSHHLVQRCLTVLPISVYQNGQTLSHVIYQHHLGGPLRKTW